MTKSFRCNACGNLTRFDLDVTRRTRALYHYETNGDLIEVTEEVVVEETLNSMRCRWCDNGGDVVERETKEAEADPVTTE